MVHVLMNVDALHLYGSLEDLRCIPPPQTQGWIYAELFKSSLKMKAEDKRRRG